MIEKVKNRRLSYNSINLVVRTIPQSQSNWYAGTYLCCLPDNSLEQELNHIGKKYKRLQRI